MTIKSINVVCCYRIRLPVGFLDLLESTNDAVCIRKTRYERYTWRGVPARQCDIIVAERIRRQEDISESEVVLEVGEKSGRYDGQTRRRYAVRPMTDRTQLAGIPAADLYISKTADTLTITVRPPNVGATIVDEFRVLRSNLDDYDLSRIIGWHWRRYYTHLTDQDCVREFADSWEEEVRATGECENWTLAEANRAASRALYRLSRELGWRKLTVRERDALGFDPVAGCWQAESEVARRLEMLQKYSATGCGEATLTAANTGHWPIHPDIF